MKKNKMKVITVRKEDLSEETKEEMWMLYSSNYDNTTRQEFEEDLKEKNKIFIGRDSKTNEFAGFSAMQLYTQKVGSKKIAVIYPGDTMIRKEYWGQKGLHNQFFIENLKFKIMNPFTPLYFFIICMGYKTYLITTKNCPEYYPRYDRETPKEMQEVLEEVAGQKFGDDYNVDSHIVSISSTEATLGKNVAQITPAIAEIPEVKFFLKMNPSYQSGDELASIAVINWKWFCSLGYKNTIGILLKNTRLSLKGFGWRYSNG